MNFGLWWVRPALYAAVVVALLAAFGMFVRHERALGAAQTEAKLRKSFEEGAAKARAEAEALTTQKLTAVEASHVRDIQRAEALAADRNAARSELERLRDRLRHPDPAAAGAPAAPGPVADETAPYRELLEACSGRYEAVAGTAGHLADQVTGLQGYVRGVLAGEPNEMEGMPSATPVGERSPAGSRFLAAQPTTEPSGPTPASAAPPILGASQ